MRLFRNDLSGLFGTSKRRLHGGGQRRMGRHRVLRRIGPHATHRHPGQRGNSLKNYNVEAQCTPTRAAILSGRLPVRTGNCSVPLPGQGDYGLVNWEYTLANLFSDAGYATAAFGKWHVGESRDAYPLIRASTSGGSGSRTPRTRPPIRRTRCSGTRASRCRRFGRVWPDRQ